MTNDHLVNETIDLISGGSRCQQSPGLVQHGLGQLATLSQHFYAFLAVDFRRRILVRLVVYVARIRVRRNGNVSRHGPRIANVPRIRYHVVDAEIRFNFRPQRLYRLAVGQQPVDHGGALAKVHRRF